MTSPVSSSSFLPKRKSGCLTADNYKSYPAELFLRFITLLGLACCLIVQAVVADVAGPGGDGGGGGGGGNVVGCDQHGEEEGGDGLIRGGGMGPHGKEYHQADQDAAP